MLSSVKSLILNLQRVLIRLLSFFLVLILCLQPVNALNDGQQLVLEAWALVNEGYLNPEKLDEIKWRKIRQRALEKPITTSFQAYAAIDAMFKRIDDPYTRLIRPANFEALKSSNIGNEINGVGLQLGLRELDKEIVVIAPLEGSPAADAGITSGTILTKVNNEAVKELGLEATASKLRGEVGSQVSIEIQAPNDELQEISLERRSFDLRPVRTKRLRNETHTFGYLRITQFSEVVPNQVKEAIQELMQKDIDGIILDLRNNSGGLVSAGLAVADAFISDSPIVETKNREGISDPISANVENLYDGPMVTLVNGGTASASEILAGALQDNNRSELIGSKTFGKGVIQSLSNLSDGSGIAITVASYLTPSGRDIQNLGIEPNKTLEPPEPLNPGSSDDRWLQDAELYMEAILDMENIEIQKSAEINNKDIEDLSKNK